MLGRNCVDAALLSGRCVALLGGRRGVDIAMLGRGCVDTTLLGGRCIVIALFGGGRVVSTLSEGHTSADDLCSELCTEVKRLAGES